MKRGRNNRENKDKEGQEGKIGTGRGERERREDAEMGRPWDKGWAGGGGRTVKKMEEGQTYGERERESESEKRDREREKGERKGGTTLGWGGRLRGK